MSDDFVMPEKQDIQVYDPVPNEHHRSQFKGYVENGATCMEVDMITPVERIFDGKDLFVRGLLGELIYFIVQPGCCWAKSKDGRLGATLKKEGSHYVCICLMDLEMIEKAEF